MSLHANLTPEALQRLKAQQRRSFISSAVIAFLTLVLVGLILGFVLLPTLVKETPTIVTYESNISKDTELETKKVMTNMERKPSSPSSSMAKVIAANTNSPTAVPVPDVEVTTPSLDFGDGDDFGTGWGSGSGGSGAGGGGGGSTGFGMASGVGLVGTFFDLKQDNNGKPNKMEIQLDERGGAFFIDAPVNKQYDRVVSGLVSRRMSDDALKDYFRAPESLILTQLYIPAISAEEAPRAFKVADKAKGRRWVVVYRGKVVAPESGSFRFVGFGDDVLVVRLDGRIVLDASFAPPTQKSQRKRYPHDHIPFGWQSIIGEKFNVREGAVLTMELLIGERPGGEYSGYLLIEKMDLDYPKDAKGAPKLPIFKLAPSETPAGGRAVPEVSPDTSWSVWRVQP